MAGVCRSEPTGTVGSDGSGPTMTPGVPAHAESVAAKATSNNIFMGETLDSVSTRGGMAAFVDPDRRSADGKWTAHIPTTVDIIAASEDVAVQAAEMRGGRSRRDRSTPSRSSITSVAPAASSNRGMVNASKIAATAK